MHMYIHETGKNGGMTQVNHRNTGEHRQRTGNGNNTAILNRNVNRAELAVRKKLGIFQDIVQHTYPFPGLTAVPASGTA